jgi:hypothetical protein
VFVTESVRTDNERIHQAGETGEPVDLTRSRKPEFGCMTQGVYREMRGTKMTDAN